MISFRKMLEKDIPKVAEIEKEIFSIPWSEKAFLDSLKSDNTIYMVAIAEEKVVGYCGMYLYTPEANITNVAVDKQYRRKNVAEQLVDNIIKKGKELGITDITLEVRESNVGAIALYEKSGFEEAGIRKNFYQRPTENALIMWKHNL